MSRTAEQKHLESERRAELVALHFGWEVSGYGNRSASFTRQDGSYKRQFTLCPTAMNALVAWVEAQGVLVLIGPEYQQIADSKWCSSAWGVNCCDLDKDHDGLHHDKTNGNRWLAHETVNRSTESLG